MYASVEETRLEEDAALKIVRKTPLRGWLPTTGQPPSLSSLLFSLSFF
jgi:hypothetical protein